MAILDNLSNRNKSILERRYIDQVLDEEAKNIISAQNRLDRKFGFKTNQVGYGRSARVSGNILTLQHNIVERFVDMRKIRGKKKQYHSIHNRVIFGHFNNIIDKLQFGFSQSVKAQLSQQINIEIDG